MAIVAIAKDESRYLREWILYHLAIGVYRIVLYDNDSNDETSDILRDLSNRLPITVIEWPSVYRISPQRSAYNNAVSLVSDCEWALFIDIDEFIVPWGYDDLPSFVRTIPDSVSAVGINWVNFGSAGLESGDYESVIKTFTHCARREWGNHRHIKTLARIAAIGKVKIHDVELRYGEKVNSLFDPLVMIDEGRARDQVYGGIQINHYQTKTFPEFAARMARGNANFFPGHPSKGRNGRRDRFDTLDRNEAEDHRIAKFFDAFDALSKRIG